MISVKWKTGERKQVESSKLRDTRSHPWVLNELLRKRVRCMVRSSMDANSDEFDAEFEIALDKSQARGLSFDRKFKGRWV